MHEEDKAHDDGEPAELMQPAQEDLLDLNTIMRDFGISEWKNLGRDETIPGEGLHLLVEVAGQRYVLRERPEGMLDEDLSHRYAFRRYLQQAGIPIPDVRLTPQGEPAVTIGEDTFELQQWVGGDVFNTADANSLAQVGFAGTMLGRIHHASSQYTGNQHHWPSEVHMGAMVQNWLNMARGKADASAIQAIAAGLNNWVDQWETLLPAAMMSIGAGGPVPEFHIHGDYHAHNLRFGTFGVTAVMGLEASRWEKRLFEVAYALFYFSALTWQPGEPLNRPLMKRGLEPERARHFLHAYSESCPPARGEAQLLTDALMLVAPVVTINGPLEDLFYAQDEPDSAVIDDVMERLAWAASLPSWLNRVRSSLAEMWM